MLDTRAVLAVLGGLLLLAGVVVHRRGAESAGYGLFALGFAAAGGWGWLTVLRSRAGGPTVVSADVALALCVSAVALGLVFLDATRRAVRR